MAKPAKPPTPPPALAKVKSWNEGRVAPPVCEASWRMARITKEIIALYSTKTKNHCSRTVGLIPRIDMYARPAMIAVATSQVTGLENLSPVGATTKRK